MKIPRFIEQVGLAEIHVGVTALDVDLHTQQITLLPTSTEGLSIPSALLFTKDQTQREGNNNCN